MRHQGPPAVITLPGQTVVYGHTAWWHNALYVSCQIKVYSAKDDRKPGSQQSLLYTVDFLGPLVKGFSKVWKLHLLVPAHLHVSLLPWRNLRRALQPVSSLEKPRLTRRPQHVPMGTQASWVQLRGGSGFREAGSRPCRHMCGCGHVPNTACLSLKEKTRCRGVGRGAPNPSADILPSYYE